MSVNSNQQRNQNFAPNNNNQNGNNSNMQYDVDNPFEFKQLQQGNTNQNQGNSGIQRGNNNRNNNQNQRDAEAWLNLQVEGVDANGDKVMHNIRCFIPLTSDNAVHRALIGKGEQMQGESFVIHGTVNKVQSQDIDIVLI